MGLYAAEEEVCCCPGCCELHVGVKLHSAEVEVCFCAGWCQPGAKLHGGVGLPTIARGMQSLRSSRLRAIYTEVAPTFTVFGALFGKALQAQVHPMQEQHFSRSKIC